MKFNPDDPKWTAYVLGELSKTERAELERELESSAAAREAVEEIQMATLLLKDEFAKEAPVTLLAEQRQTIRAKVPKPSWGLRQLVFAGAAACLMVGMIAAPWAMRSLRNDDTTKIVQDVVRGTASQAPVDEGAAREAERTIAPTASSTEEDQAADRKVIFGQTGQPLRDVQTVTTQKLENDSLDLFATPPANVKVPEIPVAELSARARSQVPNTIPIQQSEVINPLPPPSLAIRGVVKDQTGAVLPGVEVSVVDTSRGTSRKAVTDGTGAYIVPVLPGSPYRLEASLPGFRTYVQSGVGPSSTVNPVLQVGQVAETVEVQAKPSAVETRSTGAVLSGVVGALRSNREAAPPPPPPPPPPGSAPAPARILLDRADRPAFNTEAYDQITDNPFLRVSQEPLATFSIDVDTASYANMRRFLSQNQLPPKDSVRIEEMINYFSYDYASPRGAHPIAGYTEIASAPWKPEHRLVRIGIKGREVNAANRPSSNLVFLIDVSGSMNSPEKLPLLKAGMNLLVDKLTENDRVAIVVYAGASGVVLRSTTGDKKQQIHNAIEQLGAGGSTNGAAGIQLAYDTAVSNFIRGGINRVVLATDGDFNVGITNQGDLLRLIEDKAKSNVFLSVLGFGIGNYKDSTLEKLADKGNGNYAYIDTINEARKVLVEEVGSTLMTIAKDVKIQIEFNPAQVTAYRLIGYENRLLRNEDFNDDRKDAGDMGAGHTVTALFEVVPNGVNMPTPNVDPLKYQQPAQVNRTAGNRELLNLKVRYKDPEGTESKLLEVPVMDRGAAFSTASGDYRFAAAVASFGMILRDSPHKGQSTLDAVIDMAERSKGQDKSGYREEFVRLARKARALRDLQ